MSAYRHDPRLPTLASGVGFTGSRSTPTAAQMAWLRDFLIIEEVCSLAHGACAGSDEFAHKLALDLRLTVTVYPPEDKKHLMATPLNGDFTVFPPRPYLVRNHLIVDHHDTLVALPSGPERLRSGTWATIRYARKKMKYVVICYPDGTWEA